MLNRLKVRIKHVPAVRRIIQADQFRSLRHRLILQFDDREDRTFTRFLRLPTQYEVLAGPVMDFLGVDPEAGELSLIVLGCSKGAEAYSIASTLCAELPGLRFTIRAVDVKEAVIRQARQGTYSAEELFTHKGITQEFVQSTFVQENGRFVVRQEVKERVSFDVVDLLDSDSARSLGQADVVFMQNLLVNLKRPRAIAAFRNACSMLKPRSVLFVDGMDLDLRSKLTRRYGLEPFTYRLDRIYGEAREERGAGWPYNYWGVEPFLLHRRDWLRRYGTIFVRDKEKACLSP